MGAVLIGARPEGRTYRDSFRSVAKAEWQCEEGGGFERAHFKGFQQFLARSGPQHS